MSRDDLRGWELLCDQQPNEEALTAMQKMRGFYRTRTYRSGDLLEVEVYPVIPRRIIREALEKKGETREAQRRLNQRNAEKKFRRLVERNFGEGDYYFTGTIEGEELPTLEKVQKIIQNFLRRVNWKRKRAGLENAKYVYVIEGWEEGSRQKRLHVHLIIDGGIDRKELKEMWSHGRTKCEELDPKAYGGLSALAQYLTKDPRGRKRWSASKNLKGPLIAVAERKVSSRTAHRISEDTAGRAAALEKLYPGYAHENTEVRTNPFIAGAYIYAVMRREPSKKTDKGGKRQNESGDSYGKGGKRAGIRTDAKRNCKGVVPNGGEERVQKRRGKARG